jgi:hypothetical protein
VAQVVECLPSKGETLSLKPRTAHLPLNQVLSEGLCEPPNFVLKSQAESTLQQFWETSKMSLSKHEVINPSCSLSYHVYFRVSIVTYPEVISSTVQSLPAPLWVRSCKCSREWQHVSFGVCPASCHLCIRELCLFWALLALQHRISCSPFSFSVKQSILRLPRCSVPQWQVCPRTAVGNGLVPSWPADIDSIRSLQLLQVSDS